MAPRKLTYAIYIPMTWLKIPRNTTIVPREYVFAFYVTPPVRSPNGPNGPHGRSWQKHGGDTSESPQEMRSSKDVHWKNHENPWTFAEKIEFDKGLEAHRLFRLFLFYSCPKRKTRDIWSLVHSQTLDGGRRRMDSTNSSLSNVWIIGLKVPQSI